MTLTLDEARERLRATVEEYIKLDAELRALENTNYRVCIFGSARIWPKDPIYHSVFRLAQSLSERGIDVVTGGGPGLMEAANRGAFEVGALSIGLNIALPAEQEPNRYLTPGLGLSFRYFALRKLHFLLRARAVVAFPGGFGTLDELFETLTLMQTGKMRPLPVVLVGHAYWRHVFDAEYLAAQGAIDRADLHLISYAETAIEAWEQITGWYARAREPVFP